MRDTKHIESLVSCSSGVNLHQLLAGPFHAAWGIEHETNILTGEPG